MCRQFLLNLLSVLVSFSQPVRGNLSTELPPFGFHRPDSKDLPPKLTAVAQRAAQGSVRVALRLKAAQGEIPKGTIYSQGSGVIIEPGDQVWTNSHVVATAKANPEVLEIVVLSQGGKTETLAEIRADDKERDFASLQLPVKLPGELPVADPSADYVGQAILHVGHPFAVTEPRVVFGHVMEKLPDERLLLSCSSLPGNSGGPVLSYDPDTKALSVITLIVGIENARLEDQILIFDYLNLSSLSRRFAAIANHPDLSKGLGENPEETLSGWMPTQHSPEYRAALWNLQVVANEASAKATVASWEKISKLLREMIALKPNEATFRTIHKSILSRVRTQRNFQSITVDPPLMTDVQITALFRENRETQVRELTRYADALDARIQQIPQRALIEREKHALYSSIPALLKRLQELNKRPDLRQTDAYLNDSFFVTPALGIRVEAAPR